jgi:hypothetical protein
MQPSKSAELVLRFVQFQVIANGAILDETGPVARISVHPVGMGSSSSKLQ